MRSSERFVGNNLETSESSLSESDTENLQTQPIAQWKFISLKEVPKRQLNFLSQISRATQIKTRYVSLGGDDED